MSWTRSRAGGRQALPVLTGGPESGEIPSSEPLGCIKVAYADEAEARAAIGRSVTMCKGALRSYRCAVCSRWHLTSKRGDRRWRVKT